MTTALAPRAFLTAALLAAAALLVGALASVHPNYAIGLAAVALVTLLAFAAPVTHLTLLLALTTIVPYAIQGLYHLGGGGAGNGGLQASDLFLLTGLLRAALVLPRTALARRQRIVIGLVLASIALTVFAAVTGLQAGQGVSNVGAEFRGLGGGIAFTLIVVTALADPGAHPRMLRALVVFGLALGLWGIVQWTFDVGFGGTDFGVRAGVGLTSNGVGQLQGGLFAFPIVVTLAASALASGALRDWRRRALVIVVLLLNVISLLLTFERTFWVATVIAILLVALRSGRARRIRVLLVVVTCAIIGTTILAAVSPNTLQTAEQRLLSIGQYQTDNSVRYRSVESGFVLAKIEAKPIFGWGLADTIYWGQPWTSTPPSAQSYSHVGYLWLLWREGIVGTGVLLLLVLLSAMWTGRARGGDLVAAIKVGCQVSLLALLIINFTFPVFNQGSQATYMVGVLLAYCALPVLPRRALARSRAAVA